MERSATARARRAGRFRRLGSEYRSATGVVEQEFWLDPGAAADGAERFEGLLGADIIAALSAFDYLVGVLGDATLLSQDRHAVSIPPGPVVGVVG